MRKYLTLLFTAWSFVAYGQVDPAIWNQLKPIGTPVYQLQIPDKWRQLPTGGAGPEQFFEASGLALPASHDGAPVMVTAFVVRQPGQHLEDCRQKCLAGYRENPDREFPADYAPGVEKIKLASGQDAYLLSTHFYRTSKGLHQSRYDLVVYSEQAHAGYLYTLSIQYRSPQYQFEQAHDLAGFARQLFRYFRLV